MKKLLAVAAVLAPMIALLPAAPASAGTTCVPITVDGQPVFCTDTTPVTDAVAQAEALLAQAESTLLGLPATAVAIATNLASKATTETRCLRFEPQPGGAKVYIAEDSTTDSGIDSCWGYEISVTAQTASQPVHVPQVCLTTTGTCVGPFDETVPVPDQTQPVEVCAVSMFWYRPTGSSQPWTEEQAAWPQTVGCVDIPA